MRATQQYTLRYTRGIPVITQIKLDIRAFFKQTNSLAFVGFSFSSEHLDRRALSRHAEPYRLGDMVVDYVGHEVTVAGRAARLTPTEYRLLLELCTNAGRVLTYDQILERVWGAGSRGGPQRVRTFVKDLRQKLGDDARNPAYLFTEPGIGYRIGPPPA